MRPLHGRELEEAFSRIERREVWKHAADVRIIREATEFPEAPHVLRVLGLLAQLQRAETLRLELYPHRHELVLEPGSRFFSPRFLPKVARKVAEGYGCHVVDDLHNNRGGGWAVLALSCRLALGAATSTLHSSRPAG